MTESLGQALLIANANYSDKTLSALSGTEVDVRALEAVLTDPAIGGYQVQTSLDEPIHRLRQRIERFFVQAPKDSLLLLYLSGHGVKDRDGRLYFAAADTESSFLMSTGLAATFIQEVSERSRCRRQVFIFDACFSGAFARGYFHKSDQKVHAQESFGGRGKIVITASDDIQYALVGDEIEGDATASVFTRHLVEGLRTGAAANDAEVITAGRLYQYVYERVLEDNPAQKPQLWTFGLNAGLILARNPAPKPIKLPVELVELLEDPRPKVRLLGIDEMKKFLVEPRFHQVINVALDKLRDDDSKIVSARAAEVQAELEQLRKEAERKRQAEAEAKRQAEEERKHRAEAEAKRQAEEERKHRVEAEAKRQAEEERKHRAEAEAKRRAEEERKHRAEAEAKRQAQPGPARVLAPGQTFRDRLQTGADGPLMVVIPAGRFRMGSPADELERLEDEGPQHEVRIAVPFAMGVYAVTFEDYERFCDDVKLGKPQDQGWGRGQRPVISVSWEEARAYCAWLGEQTGRIYRLSSEAEWEYACRAGTDTPFYCGPRITADQSNFNGNYTYNGSAKGEYRAQTVEVACFAPNAFALYDMHGNVWEWCEDAWHSSYEGAPADDSAWEGEEKGFRVARGGSWSSEPRYCRAASRGYSDIRGGNIGFRVCCAAPTE